MARLYRVLTRRTICGEGASGDEGNVDVGNGMRALKALTIGMGVLILAGTALLVAVIFHRASAPHEAKPIALLLQEPAGTRIAGIAATQDRLAVSLTGGGVDRVVLVNPATGAVAGRITLAH